MDFYQQFKPYTEEELKDLEMNLGVTLPGDYRRFLLQCGGGQPANTVFQQRDKQGKLVRAILVNVFLGNSPVSGADLFSRHAVLSDRIPSDCLPIASNGGSDYLCLGIKGNNYGKVFMWWKDGEADIGAKPTHKNIEFIADSFDEIASNLKPEEAFDEIE